MIIRSYLDFARAVDAFCRDACVRPESHKNEATFTLGHPRKGFYLKVDSQGWRAYLEGVETSRQGHIAAPLSNLQAAAITMMKGVS